MSEEKKLGYREYPDHRVVKDGLREFEEKRLKRRQGTIEEWRTEVGCAFHSSDQSKLFIKDYPNVAGGMTLQGAKYQSHEAHCLVRPTQKCWDEERIRTMGGEADLNELFDVIFAPHIDTGDFVDLVHYNGDERSAASEPDFHMHMMVNQRPPHLMNHELNERMNERFASSKYVIAQNGNIIAVVDSIHQVGEVQFVQTDYSQHVSLPRLVNVLCETIRLFARAFANTRHESLGLPPDFQLQLEFMGGRLYSGGFIPMLAGVGIEQRRLRPTPHQWTPAETHRRLMAYK